MARLGDLGPLVAVQGRVVDDECAADVVEDVELGGVYQLEEVAPLLVVVEDVDAIAVGEHAHAQRHVARAREADGRRVGERPVFAEQAEAREDVLRVRVAERYPVAFDAPLHVGAQGRLVHVGDGLVGRAAVPRALPGGALEHHLLHTVLRLDAQHVTHPHRGDGERKVTEYEQGYDCHSPDDAALCMVGGYVDGVLHRPYLGKAHSHLKQSYDDVEQGLQPVV